MIACLCVCSASSYFDKLHWFRVDFTNISQVWHPLPLSRYLKFVNVSSCHLHCECATETCCFKLELFVSLERCGHLNLIYFFSQTFSPSWSFFSLNNMNLFHATWILTVCQCCILIGLVRFVTCAAYWLIILNPHGRHHHGADGQLGRLSLCGSIGFAVLVIVIDIGGLKERAVSSTGGHRRGRAIYRITSTLTLIFWHTEQRSNKMYSHTNIFIEKECLEWNTISLFYPINITLLNKSVNFL